MADNKVSYKQSADGTRVKVINYSGKDYIDVAERLRLAREKEVDFEVLDSDFKEIGGRIVCKVKISVNGKVYHGNAEAKVHNAAANSADAKNPFECAETSAVGRALAFAGFGTIDGIASFDEIARSMTPEELAAARNPRQPEHAAPANNNPPRPSAPARPAQQSRQTEQPAPAQTAPVPATPKLTLVPTPGNNTNADPRPASQLRKWVQDNKPKNDKGAVMNWPMVLAGACADKIQSGEWTVKQLVDAQDELPPHVCAKVETFIKQFTNTGAA